MRQGDHLIYADIRKGKYVGQFKVDIKEKYLSCKEVDADESDLDSEDENSSRSFNEKYPVQKEI